MKIARVEKDSKETYALVHNGSLLLKEDLEKDLGKDLPLTIEEFLFKGVHTASVVPLEPEMAKREPLYPVQNLPPTIRLLPPISRPSKIICLGFNYLDHAKERGRTPPEEPVIFIKPRTTLIGAHDNIVCPRFVTKLDYEGELALVIGRECKNVSDEDAIGCVLGYMVFNDVSARNIQFKDKQWTRGKGFDTFAPCGPWITTKEEIPEPHNLRIVTRVNGRIRQNSSTGMMAIRIERMVSSLSRVMTLEQGDLIATGTPSGVAAFMEEPQYLRQGDIVEVEIEGLGRIRNGVVFT